MDIGGLIARAALLKAQMKRKPCRRCGLHYDPEQDQQCPHCGGLDQAALFRLLEQREREFQGNRRLGFWFFVAAVCTLFIMIFI